MERRHKNKFSFHAICIVIQRPAVLKIDSVYQQGKNYHPQTYVEECKYTDVEKQGPSMLSDDDDDGLFEV